jgi:hypothetical protein
VQERETALKRKKDIRPRQLETRAPAGLTWTWRISFGIDAFASVQAYVIPATELSG